MHSSPPLPYGAAIQQHACAPGEYGISGCMVFAETTQSSKEADSFRPLLGLDHPVSKIPAATPPREAPKLPRCTAQPAQLRPHIISSQLVVLCVSVCPAVLPCLRRRPWAATTRSSPRTEYRSGPATAQRRDDTADCPASWAGPRRVSHLVPVQSYVVQSDLQLCTICICTDAARNTTDWERGVCVTSALYRLNLGAGPTGGRSSLLHAHSQDARHATLRRT